MQKYTLNAIPSPFIDMFRGREQQSTVRSRSDSTFVQAPSRTQKYMQSVRCAGPSVINKIPPEIKFDLERNYSDSFRSPRSFFNFLTHVKPFILNNVDFI